MECCNWIKKRRFDEIKRMVSINELLQIIAGKRKVNQH